jgi:PAS domain S-box-containing protein
MDYRKMRNACKQLIRDSNQMPFHSIIEVISDGILIVNKDGIILFANPVAENLFGGNHKKIVGEMFDLPVAENKTTVLDIYRNKQKLVVELKVQKIEWQGKECSLISLRDISERIHADEERIRLAAAIKHAAEGIIITDRKGIIQYVNPAFENIAGFHKKDLIGKSLHQFKNNGLKSQNFDILWEKMKQKKVWQGRLLNRKKNGESMEIEASLSPISNRGGGISGFVVWERDITNQCKLEKQMRQSQKLEAIGNLAGGIAHDFNNILMAIIGYTDLTLATYKENKEILLNLTNVLNAGYRARDLVNQILTFSQQHEGERKPLNLAMLVKESLKFLRATLPASINIMCCIEPDIKYIYADYTQCYQIIMNLCTNAAAAMQEKGGELKISISNIDLTPHFTQAYPHMQPGPYVKLAVSDTGHGIREEIIDKIFEPYFTTKQHDKGSGLGLAVVHGIVNSYGGTITVSSEAAKGSVFTLYLPAVVDKKIQSEKKAMPAAGNEKILFVDDESMLAELGKRMLTSLGYWVNSKTDSKEALKYFKKYPKQFDLVITDMTMPNLSGAELACAMLQIRPDLPIILCTGYHEKMSAKEAQKLGIKAFIAKPLVRNELGDVVNRVLLKEKKSHG